MKYKRGIVFLFLLVGCLFSMSAQQKKSCLIFSGESGQEYVIDTERYCRIYFDSNGMRLSNPENPDDIIELLYSAYHRFRVDEADINSEVTEIPIVDCRLRYDSESQAVIMSGTDNAVYQIGIFDLKGTMVVSRIIGCGERISVANLGAGVYVAVAISGNFKDETLKFVKK